MATPPNNGITLFGYRLGKVEDLKKKAEDIPSFAPPPNDDGSLEIAPGGAYGTYVDLEGSAKNEGELVTKYRELAIQAEVDSAIDDIVNEAIIHEDNKAPIEINLDEIDDKVLSPKLKERIREEFKTVLKLLDFDNMAYDIFRRWYIDGRLYYHMMINEKTPREGIKELRYIDPRRIRKVREPIKQTPQPRTGATQVVRPIEYNEYFLYMQTVNSGTAFAQQGIKISKDSIAYVHSGLMDQKNRMVLGYLHKAIKPMNQLRMLEDAVVIYRLSRAPERRIFYIDVGNLPKMKAEQYLRDMMAKHKNRLVYDASTGEIRDDRKVMTMLEDFWLPRREGGRGTEITTLPAGQNLGEMEDVEYFRRKLYKALHVPVSRIQSEQTFNFGRASEITRDEVKFSKMIDRLRKRFNHLFDSILETQLILRGVMTREEFKLIKELIHYDYLRDNYFAELKEQEVLNARLGLLQNIDPYTGKYYSVKYVREKILHMTEEEIEEMDEQIQIEQSEMMDQQQQMMASGMVDPNNGQPIQPGMGGPPQGPQQTQPVRSKPPPTKKPATPQQKKEIQEVVLDKPLSPEEKRLVESMTKLINGTIESLDLDDDE